MMFTKKWWQRAGERMAKTAAQTFLYMIGSNQLGPTINPDWTHLQWQFIGVSVAGMTLMSLASSIITTPFGPNPEDPSPL